MLSKTVKQLVLLYEMAFLYLFGKAIFYSVGINKACKS